MMWFFLFVLLNWISFSLSHQISKSVKSLKRLKIKNKQISLDFYLKSKIQHAHMIKKRKHKFEEKKLINEMV